MHKTNIGEGNIINAFNYFTYDGKIGNFNNFLCNSLFGHDIIIEDFCQINSLCSISGNVSIGNECLIGTGSVIKENVSIGNNSIIGMGSVIINNVPGGKTYFGNPARPIWIRKNNAY